MPPLVPPGLRAVLRPEAARLAVGLGLLLLIQALPATAHSPKATEPGKAAAERTQPGALRPSRATRALRIPPLERALPVAGQSFEASSPSVVLPGPRLVERLELRLRPAPLSAPVPPGGRMGYTALVLSLPIHSSVELRTGVRVDYLSQDNSLGTGAGPTLGFAFDF